MSKITYRWLLRERIAERGMFKTTEIYTSVSSDYKTRVLRDALDRVIGQADDVTGQGGLR